MPTTKREGLCNAVQIIVNAMEAKNTESALYAAVDLLCDLRSTSNPYKIPGPVPSKSTSRQSTQGAK